MNSPMPLIVAIVGRSKVGKTTFIEKLIPLLRMRGLKVGTIKHHPGDFDIDVPGKDTYRHKSAGATFTIIASPQKIGLVRDVEKDLPVEELIVMYGGGVDLIIVEGYKKARLPKIEVYDKKRGEPPVCLHDPDLIAIIADEPVDAPVPRFLPADAEGVAELIITKQLIR
jgi:molybdopterin-guanine dinucleotide biosynthesis adapter protein